MIDFHCHLDLYPDPIDVTKKAAKNNRFTLAVTTSPRAWKATSQVFAPFKNIEVALGMHPELVAKKASERSLLIELVKKTNFVGEVGIDGSPRFRGSLDLQKEVFESLVCECSMVGGRIMSIHSRSAEEEVLRILSKFPDAGIAVLHWFSGSRKALNQAIDQGCWFSVGPSMVRSKRGKQILDAMPIERLLPESDGPFARIGGEPVWPWEAIKIADELSKARGIPAKEVIDQINSNLKAIMKISYAQH